MRRKWKVWSFHRMKATCLHVYICKHWLKRETSLSTVTEIWTQTRHANLVGSLLKKSKDSSRFSGMNAYVASLKVAILFWNQTLKYTWDIIHFPRPQSRRPSSGVCPISSIMRSISATGEQAQTLTCKWYDETQLGYQGRSDKLGPGCRQETPKMPLLKTHAGATRGKPWLIDH